MATHPVVKMIHSLSNYSFEDLKMIAENECVAIPEQVSKIELITIIISARAGREGRDSVYKMVREDNNNREKYYLRTEDEKYYLRLTTEQTAMLEWCLDHEINFCGATLESIGEVEWEIP